MEPTRCPLGEILEPDSGDNMSATRWIVVCALISAIAMPVLAQTKGSNMEAGFDWRRGEVEAKRPPPRHLCVIVTILFSLPGVVAAAIHCGTTTSKTSEMWAEPSIASTGIGRNDRSWVRVRRYWGVDRGGWRHGLSIRGGERTRRRTRRQDPGCWARCGL